EHYNKHKDDYLPAVREAVYLRIAQKNIATDQPILKVDLKELGKPEAIEAKLLPGMRAINFAVTKDHSAGGLILPGAWVDVLFTSHIEGPSGATTRTATLVPRVRVVAKRNTIWPVFAPLPEDKPVHFTLE